MKNYTISGHRGERIFVFIDAPNDGKEGIITEFRDVNSELIREGFTFEVGDRINEGDLISYARRNNYSLAAYDQYILLEELYEFDSEMRFTITTTAINQPMVIPAAGVNNFTIDWGDTTVETITTVSPSHTYAVAGSYQIKINGEMSLFAFNDTGSKDLVVSLENMGDTELASMENFMFGCSNLTSANLNNFAAPSNVINAFRGCSSLVNLMTTTFDTSNISLFSTFLALCSSLVTFDTRFWNTSNVTRIPNFVFLCSSLEYIDVSNWDTSNVTTIAFFARECAALQSLDVSRWDTSKVTDFRSVIDRSTLLTELDVSNWDVSSGTNFFGFANAATGLIRLDVRNWDVSNVTNFEQFADECTALVELDVSLWDVRKVTNFTSFIRLTAIKNLDTTNWVTAANPTVNFFADGCTALISTINPNAFWLNTSITTFNRAFRAAVNIANFSDIPVNWRT